MAASKNIKPLTWIFISLVGFALFLLLAVLLVSYGSKLEISLPIYFFLLVIVALTATGFLSGALRSGASYTGDVYKGKLYLAGPALVFVIILFIGYRFRPIPDEGPLSLTINLFGPEGRSEAITNGAIKVQFENDTRIEDVNTKGQAVFSQINPAFSKKQVRIIPVVGKYFFPGGDTLVELSSRNQVIDLQLQKEKHSITVRGIVVTTEGKIVKDAVVNFSEFAQIANTNEHGNFEVKVPADEGVETQVVISVNDKIVYHNKLTLASFITIPVNL